MVYMTKYTFLKMNFGRGGSWSFWISYINYLGIQEQRRANKSMDQCSVKMLTVVRDVLKKTGSLKSFPLYPDADFILI